MGSRRLPALAALLRGSVSHGVARSSDVPLLIGAPGRGANAQEEARSDEAGP
jgi:hypothetical protein